MEIKAKETVNEMHTAFPHIHPHTPHAGPRPPHERNMLVHAELSEKDWALLKEMFGDEDSAYAAVQIIRDSPPEIQILAMQLLDLIEEVA